MIPQRLRLRSVRTFADLDVEIPDGITAVLGPNGSGKTTLLSALDVALFAERGEMAAELTRGEESCLIELTVEHDGDVFRVRRSYDGRGRGKSLLDFERQWSSESTYGHGFSETTARAGGWEPLTRESIDATQALICSTFGVTRTQLRASSFLGQGGPGCFLDLAPAARKAALADILALDSYRTMHERARAEKNAAEHERTRLAAVAQGWQVVVDGRPAADAALVNAQEEEEHAESLLGHAEIQNAKARDALAAQAAAIERVRTADAEHRAVVAQVRERERLFAEVKSLNGQADVLWRRADGMERHGDLTCDRCQQKIATTEARLRSMESLRREASGLVAQVQERERRADALPQYATAAAERLAEARAAAGDAATLAQGVRDAEARVRTARAALDEVRARIVRAQADLERCEQAEQDLAAAIEGARVVGERLDLLTLAERMYGPSGIPVLVAENAIPLIEQEANRILAMMPTVDGETFVAELHTQREQKTVANVRETLDVVVHGDAGPWMYDADRRSHSGGESSRLRLAFALGLAALIARRTRVEFLVVDELPYLDTLGQEQLVTVLQSLEQTFRVVMLVAHEATLASSFDQVIAVERSAGRARVATEKVPVTA